MRDMENEKPRMQMVGFRAPEDIRERLKRLGRGNASYFILTAVIEKFRRADRGRKRGNGKVKS